jgi:hypothetical protein
MTDLITQARELGENATPEPWEADTHFVLKKQIARIEHICNADKRADAAFIAKARTLLPTLLAAYEQLQRENEQLRKERDVAISEICMKCEAAYLQEEGTMLCDNCKLHGAKGGAE